MPEAGAEWFDHAGAFAVFDGPDSPVTQSFGLGLRTPLTPSLLDLFEQFLLNHGADACHTLSPFSGFEAMELLCARGYRPMELCNVLYLDLTRNTPAPAPEIDVKPVPTDRLEDWADLSARAWTSDRPEFSSFFDDLKRIAPAREHTSCFLAALGGVPAAAAVLTVHKRVALLSSSATLPEFRCRGMQNALIAARSLHAAGQGCDLAMLVAEPGSMSHRNAQRQGFNVAYTRSKWRLPFTG
jgi:hypothetical protein